ncbi:MAG: hypothetical protein ACRDN0_12535 [Trebonia sp.]
MTAATGGGQPSNPTVYACVTGTGQVQWLEVSNPGHTCAGALHLWHWDVAGPTGKTGATGKAGIQGPAGPQGTAGIANSKLFTEVDNGAEYTVSPSPDLADTSASGATYADAGVVYNLGVIADLSPSALAFTGGTGLAENIWIGDGPQASTPGTYKLSSVDFCYGIGANSNSNDQPQDFQMQSGCGQYAGQTLTLADIANDFPPALEAYAWVGVVSSGNAVSTTNVDTIGGNEVGLLTGIPASGGVLTPYVSAGGILPASPAKGAKS